MARREEHPFAPRVSAPDLPAELAAGDGLRRDGEHFQLLFTDLDETTDASHAEISECRLAGASVDALTLTGASLVDVEVDQLRATTVSARGARLRRVRLTGGRIGTLDLGMTDIDEIELRGIRIDYLTLGGARIEDMLVADCVIGSLDLPQATAKRVRFAETRGDEVDARGLRAEDVDLRGLEMLSLTDAAALRGATLSSVQVERLARSLASALGIQVTD
ncbi:MAG: pentapeptide repeat-containing protein [Microbacterium sp.]|uniref:pentapeptide repeat-containing protein n=1 Tax=Microbacterium sp. TaxID=51671 RepID=UPI0027232316|nr:pentapeptide repeat-containing protein [Microbacterium sp.]MDO8382966.1 pentapeptide repeat-containing protein [Microbacterium sp.]